jgi:VCBS repeat-containing protein
MKIKQLINNTILSAALFLFCCNTAQAQDKGYKVKVEMNAAENGEVEITYVATYTASYWDYMKSSRSLEHSIMKSAMARQYPKYKVTDFSIKTDEDARTATVKYKVLGLLKLNEDGKWIAELDTKKPEIEKISDTKFLVSVDEEGIKQNITINLPSSASNAKVENNSFGKADLTYTAPVSGGGMGSILQYLGIAMAAGGAFLFFKNRKLNTIYVKDPQNKKVSYPQQKHIDEPLVIKPVSAQQTRPDSESNNSGQQH